MDQSTDKHFPNVGKLAEFLRRQPQYTARQANKMAMDAEGSRSGYSEDQWLRITHIGSEFTVRFLQ